MDDFIINPGSGDGVHSHPRISGEISSVKLTPLDTQALVEGAKVEHTTVHGALCAAVISVARSLKAEWNDKKLQLMSPVCARKKLNAGEEFFLCITTKPVFFDPNSEEDFWSLAREAKQGLNGVENLSHVVEFNEILQHVAFNQQQVPPVLEVLKQAFSHELMVSNLGQLKFSTQIGNFKITDLWGPMILSGRGDAQTIGAITCNGSLHLTAISENPLIGLLGKVGDLLREASQG